PRPPAPPLFPYTTLFRSRFRRVVEAQFRNSTRKLVDSDDEQRALEELLDAKAKLSVPAGFEGLHYLLYTPFRHPPLRHGSRFGRSEEHTSELQSRGHLVC